MDARPGRPIKGPEKLAVKREMSFPKTMYDHLKTRSTETGVSIAEQVRRAIGRELEIGEGVSTPPAVPLLGYIPASPARCVVHLPPGTTTPLPPHALDMPADYALLIAGASMECDDIASIPDGAYAYFQSREKTFPRNNDIVHVEFPTDNGENDCTLAIYKPHADGSVTFDKCNKKFKPIVKQPHEPFEIRGVYLQSYKEPQPKK